MGLFKKLKDMTGTPDRKLMSEGLLGRADVIGAQQTGAMVSRGPVQYPVFIFQLYVTVDGHPPFEASCRQAVPMTAAPLLAGGATVAVRVDPQDHSQVAIDLDQEPPTVRMGRREGETTAADVLARGNTVRAVVVQFQPLGMQNAEGVDLYAFVLNIQAPGQAPYQVKVGNPVPTEAVAFIAPGSNLPAKVLPEESQSVVIDWGAALAEAQAS